MLTSRKNPPSDRIMDTIVETLAERVYAHGHAIGFGEAEDIGLTVVRPTDAAEAAMWDLLCAYEDDMKMREALDPISAVAFADVYTEDAVLAVIETADLAFEFQARLEVRARRQMPPTLNVAVNISLQLPPNVQPAQLPAAVQQALQQAQQALLQQAQIAVQQAMMQQAPLLGAEVGIRSGVWRKTT
jgi:hypothetical protein